MLSSKPQSETAFAGAHLVLYDGLCGLCNRLVQFLVRHDHRCVFSFGSIQSPVGQSIIAQSGGSPGELKSFYVVADYRTAASRVFTRSDAALFVAGALGWPWRAARLIGFVPHAIRDVAYDVVARKRYLVFGRYARCAVPHPEFRDRFIDFTSRQS